MEISENEENKKATTLYPLQKSCVHFVHNMYLRTHFSWNWFKKGVYIHSLKRIEAIKKVRLLFRVLFFQYTKNIRHLFRALNVFKASEIPGSDVD